MIADAAVQSIMLKISEANAQLEELYAVVPKSFEEFNALRLKHDSIELRLSVLNSQLNALQLGVSASYIKSLVEVK